VIQGSIAADILHCNKEVFDVINKYIRRHNDMVHGSVPKVVDETGIMQLDLPTHSEIT
jgi:septum formation topological specificity factor MinE